MLSAAAIVAATVVVAGIAVIANTAAVAKTAEHEQYNKEQIIVVTHSVVPPFLKICYYMEIKEKC